jgi:tRNA(Ile)-lysidine synthase
VNKPLLNDLDCDFYTLYAYNRLYIGFSGGLDSTVLLHLITQQPTLKSKVIAIHVNHHIQDCADEWQTHCQQVCTTLGIKLITESCLLTDSQQKGNIEANAREARFNCFSKHDQSNDLLLLAHHQQDQAETLLLRLLKGSGPSGLAAIKSHSVLQGMNVYRPLLKTAKQLIKCYAKKNALNWVEDPSNQQIDLQRNYLRNKILPLLKEEFGDIVTTLNRSAALCHEQNKYVNKKIAPIFDKLQITPEQLQLPAFQLLEDFEKKIVIRMWLTQHNLRLPSAAKLSDFIVALSIAAKDKNPRLDQENYVIQRYQDKLYLYQPSPARLQDKIIWLPPYPPIKLPELNLTITLEPASTEQANLYLHKCLPITISHRLGGEVICYRNQTKSVKKLLQEMQIPPWQREKLLLVSDNTQLISIEDKLISDSFDTKTNNFLLAFTKLC